ncbi:hypothetical protein L1994_00510 [Methanomicrobium antiquum]|uniref:Uncharacterized protein n=1 Tax=Methanomicrobium antiquum TaxID=487686 RepID=A0AAF0JTX6_9EURY|nr:hypothetical protein [Methanomicrobium antiquum]WFN36913.1 hypothetical protein L1994_00510 [Methanomicrobium antiquum]
MDSNLVKKYFFVKKIVIEEGYNDEIIWQKNIIFQQISESDFLREISWVILSSGMREKVISKYFPIISNCFYNWISAEKITINKISCLEEALKIFNHKKKIASIIAAAELIFKRGFDWFKNEIVKDPINKLKEFDFIGPITVFHLAKNIGLDVAKPDRHLVRIALNEGFDDVQEFCKKISKVSGDSVPVVDVVLWRYATIEPKYLDILKKIRFVT